MVTRLSHTGIVVRNMDKMVSFYRDTFGFQVVLDAETSGKETDGIVDFHVENERIVLMQLDEQQIELLEYRPAGRGYPEDYKSNDLFGVHLALATEDMDKDYEMLKKKGVRILSRGGPQTIPDDDPQFGGTRVLYFLDPEGHPLELIQMPRQV